MNNDSEWPPMAETEFGEDGISLDGTTPISVVGIGGHGRHNKPVPSTSSAGCAYCNRWAVSFYIGTATVADGDLFNSVERRRDMTLIYFCDQHEADAGDELLEKYAAASNSLHLDLALAVQRSRTESAHAPRQLT